MKISSTMLVPGQYLSRPQTSAVALSGGKLFGHVDYFSANSGHNLETSPVVQCNR